MNEVEVKKVIGFEGGFREETMLTWGSAAIRDGSAVYNSNHPGHPNDDSDFHEALLDHYATWMPNAIELAPEQNTDEMQVLAVRKTIKADLKLTHMLASQDQGSWVAYLYQNDEQMKQDVNVYEDALLKLLEEYVDIGLTMSAHSLTPNALDTALNSLKETCKDPSFTKLMGEAILHSEKDKKKFRSIFYGEHDETV